MSAQTPGTLYQRVQGVLGQQVLDPNNDGFVSVTSAGFPVGGTDYGTNSELKMIGLPSLVDEPNSDLNNGSSGGLTDLVSSTAPNTSVFLLVKNVDGLDYLVVRFRVGSIGTSGKAYALVFDTNGTLSGANQGFELEVSLQTGSQSGGVYVRDYRVSTTQSFPINTYSQRSVALTTVNGTPDYFIDFFVPLSALGNVSQARIVAVTGNNSSSVLSSGGISDIQGVNDSNYGWNLPAIFTDLISSFPSTNLANLTSDFNGSTWLMQASVPSVNDGVTVTSTSISGTSKEATGTTIKVYKNGVLLGTTTVTNNTWSLTGVTGLVAGDLITATATALGKSVSGVSSAMIVSGAQHCFLEAPVNLVRNSSGSSYYIEGSWSGTIVPTGSNIKIELFTQTGPDVNQFTSFTPMASANSFVQSNGTFSIYVTNSNTIFNSNNFIAKATLVSGGSIICTSAYSNVSVRTNGNATANGYITPKPTIVTTPIYQSASSQQIIVSNNGADKGTTVNGVVIPANPVDAILILYVNGIEVARTASVVTPNATTTFTVSGLTEGDLVTARAQGVVTGASYWLSYVSNIVTSQLQTPTASVTPEITGPLSSGSGRTISGFSSEAPGTVITVYKGGVVLGTATVSAYGTWSLPNVTLAQGDSITATAKAVGKTVSSATLAVVVLGTAPAAPTISNEYVAGQTTITGTGASGTVRVYVDGVVVASQATTGAWSVTVSSDVLFRGAVITAKNESGGLLSVSSNSKTVTGVGGFCIVKADGSPLPTSINSGETLAVKIIAIQGITCPGTPFTGFTGTVSLSSAGVLYPTGVTSNFVNGELVTNLTFGGLGTTAITVMNTDDPTAVGQASLTVGNPALWVGTTDTDFNKATNWQNNYVPGNGAAITFAATVQNDLHLNGVRVFGTLDFNSNAHSYKVFVGATDALTLQGTIANASPQKAIQTVSGSQVHVLGYGAAGDLYFGPNSILEQFTMNRSSSGAVVLKTPIRVEGKLNLTQGTVTVAAPDGLITLASSATRTAVVPFVSGAVVGNVCVERYIPAKRAYRFLSPSVTTTTSIRANWQENGSIVPGYGTHITGPGGSSNGFDDTATNNNSLFVFNEVTGAWEAVANTNVATLQVGKGYRLMVRGDRTINMTTNTPTPTPTILRATGTLYTGTYTPSLNQSADGYTLVGNPYQAPIDISQALALANANITDQITYWDPTLNTRGGFVTRVISTNQNSTNSSFTEVLQPGQSVFLKNNSATSSRSLAVKEAHKRVLAGPANLFRSATTTTTSSASTLSLLKVKLTVFLDDQWKEIDGAVTLFGSQYNAQVDSDDAKKMSNLDEEVGFKVGSNSLAFNLQPVPLSSDELPISLSKCRFSNYRWAFDLQNYSGPTPYLLDVMTGTYTEITPATVVPFTVDIQHSSLYANRFKVVFSNQTLGTADYGLDHVTLYPNPAKVTSAFQLYGVQGAATVQLFSLLGQAIAVDLRQDASVLFVQPRQVLNAGVYIVVVAQDGKVKRMKWIVE
ncbi:T9SS type A sorting domain-containing protein [Flavobacterium sp. HXWNR69]|uniref:T9SS type A sorting domain-containing protein n=1 Tax=Flavobacterium fragile TaxID=2949085 RepID=A0ABT0TFP6_9FLAO|nr:T9SS type A sorting domain-containing protein [Flavobacterium sp. HXWNR69]MCL9769722.1 T9SS type A sorting domain-containing protein [Flavobacterium sp. HXWNR69]